MYCEIFLKFCICVKEAGRGGRVKLTTHLHLMTRLRMSGGTLLRPHTRSRCVQGHLYFYFVVTFIQSPFHPKLRGTPYANIGRREFQPSR